MQQEKSKQTSPIDKKTEQLKLANFCAYQERSQQEVREKLVKMGILSDDLEDIIAFLISENFLNEERFAIAFAGGKFRIKHWGKLKIKNALRLKGTSEPCIRKALKLIDHETYTQVLKKEIKRKAKEIPESNVIKKTNKLAAYLIGKGFESELVWDLLRAGSKK
jgi:regulatory protein